MHAYSTAAWSNFFIAEVGAMAALTGLLFVAVSINLERIIAYPWLPMRAGETLVILSNSLITASLGLVPGQSVRLLGAEVALVALVALIGALRANLRLEASHHEWAARSRRTSLGGVLVALTPFVIAGASLIAKWGGGLYWLVPGVMLSVGVALLNGWVLLVEIQR